MTVSNTIIIWNLFFSFIEVRWALNRKSSAAMKKNGDTTGLLLALASPQPGALTLLPHCGVPALLPSRGWSPRCWSSVFSPSVQQLPPSAFKHTQVSHPGKVCRCPLALTLPCPGRISFPVSCSSLDTGPSKRSSSAPAPPLCWNGSRSCRRRSLSLGVTKSRGTSVRPVGSPDRNCWVQTCAALQWTHRGGCKKADFLMLHLPTLIE